jgi:PAS domain S-box-containing protein
VVAACEVAGCEGLPAALSEGTRYGVSPWGALVFEGVCKEETIAALFRAARLAGPILHTMAAEEDYRHSTQQLDHQSRLLTSIVNSLPDPIVIINAAHEIMVQNRRAEHLLSMTDDDSEGRRRAVEINNLLFTSHLSKAAIADVGEDSAQTGARELNMVDPDEGTDLLFEVLTQPLDGADAGATVSVLRDVTDLRRAAFELERQVQRVRLAEFDATRERDRLNLILANVADPILVTDDRSNIILMNRQAELLFGGVASEEAMERSAHARAVRANDTKFTTFVSDFTISPDIARRESMRLMVPDANERELPVEVVSGKIFDKRGEPIAIVSVLHDLTKQVENERLYEELKKFNNELEARVRESIADLAEQNVRLQWQSRELERANRLKSEFLASMSHELRTPINALIGYTALMLDRIYGDINDKQQEGLSRIQAAAQHLLALINDILDLAKIEAGRMPLHLDEVALQDIVREINVQIDPLIKKKGLAYECIVPPGQLIMRTDRTKVKQILLNLLSNAVKFTQAGGVTFTATIDGDLVRIDVADTGIGIRGEDLISVWEDFRQVDQSRTREFGGTGLGLSITKKLVGALGGHVQATSIYGVGSTFTIFLPIRAEPSVDSGGDPGADPGDESADGALTPSGRGVD